MDEERESGKPMMSAQLDNDNVSLSRSFTSGEHYKVQSLWCYG